MHWFITVMRLLFSNAAATRSLSASCLFTATSDVCVPGVISTVTLKRGGNDLSSFTRIDRPINVAILQCGIVGVKFTNTSLCSLSTLTKLCWTTCNSSNVKGCSGSLIKRIKSKIQIENRNRIGHENKIVINIITPNSLFDLSLEFSCMYRKFHVHRMDHQLYHPNQLLHFFDRPIFCTHLDLNSLAPWLNW